MCNCNQTTINTNCNTCNSQPCTPTPPCDCPAGYMSTDCINNVTTEFECFEIESGQTLTETLSQMEQATCALIDGVTNYITLKNVGTGQGIYKGVNGIGEKEIKSLKSAGGTVTITTSVDGNEVNFEVGDTQSISITSDDDSVTITETDGVVDLSVDLDKSFLDLVDVIPSDYTGNALKSVRVNSAETGLEFVVDNSVKRLLTANTTGTMDAYSPNTSGDITLPNASPNQSAGLVTNTPQTIYGKKTIQFPNGTGNSGSFGFGFEIKDDTSPTNKSFFSISENGYVRILERVFFSSATDWMPLSPNTSVARAQRAGDRLHIGDQTNQDKGFNIDVTTGNFTIGSPNSAFGSTTEIFEVYSTAKGSIPFPRMTYSQRTGFTPTKTGTHVYQTNTDSGSGSAEGVYVYKSSGWVFAY